MKTISIRTNQAECAAPSGSWPECVEDSYDRLVTTIENFVTSEQNNSRVEPTRNHIAL
jgi:hypothetical protein